MGDETWHQARLIPTSGISDAAEQERRATSALLAVMSAVREFGRSLTQPFGAPVGPVESFIEVPFQHGDKKCFPDGLLRICRGQRSWTALVEVKTGTNRLDADQLDVYLDVARENGIDALVTISNEIPAIAGQHPTKVDKQKLNQIALHHYSWSQVLAEAVLQKEHRGTADPDQAWVLGELIRYLEHPRSGALEFDDMGPSWVSVRDRVSTGTLPASDRGIPDVVARFDALLRYASLLLGRQLGAAVAPALTRRELEDPALRAQALLTSLVEDGTLSGAIRIPGGAGPLAVTADLRASKLTCHVDVDAPREGWPATRVDWLVRQLRTAPETVRVEAFALHARGAGAAELLRDVRRDPALLIGAPARDLRAFRVALTGPLGAKGGTGRGTFIESVLEGIGSFHAEVIQNLKAWTPNAPRVRQVAGRPPTALVSTALSGRDRADDAAAADRATPAGGDAAR
jgi:hypothetical protein